MEDSPPPERTAMGRARRLAGITIVALGFVVVLRLVAPQSSPDVSPAPTPTASASPAAGSPPILTSDGFACAHAAPIPAYAELAHHFFDPLNPRRPGPGVAPDRCFRDDAEAEASGYSRALPPPGWYVAGGLYLGPVSDFGADLTKPCIEAANRLGFAVPCPAILPAPGVASGTPRCETGFLPNPHCVYHGAFFLQYLAFPTRTGRTVGGSGLTLAAYRSEDGRTGSFLESLLRCSGAPPKTDTTWVALVDGPERTTHGWFIECAEGLPPSQGQTLLYWSKRGVTYVVGLQGTFEMTRDVLVQVAQSVFLMPPGL